LAILQVSLGAWTVLSHKAVFITTAHVATGALLLVCTVLTTLTVVRQSGYYLIDSMAIDGTRGELA
jgi:heme A synthase